MYKICKTEKSIARQKQFQAVFLTLMEQQTYPEITVTALCQAMDAPRKTFYRYFDTLEDVLYSILDETLMQAFLCVQVTLDLEGFFAHWQKQKRLLDILQKNGLSHMLVNRIYVQLAQSIHKDRFSADDIRYSASITAIMTMVFTWHHSGMKQSVPEMCTLANSILKFNGT